MEPYKLFFMEDVVPLEHIGWLEKIRERSTVPLSQGELFNNPAEYQKLVEKRTIDYMRVHISQIGGITPARKLQLYCEQYGVRICWHGPGDMSPIAHAANIHIDLAAQNLGIQEWSGIKPPNSILQEIKGPQGALLDVFPGMPEYGNDGYVYASERPGLGGSWTKGRPPNTPVKTALRFGHRPETRTEAFRRPERADGPAIGPVRFFVRARAFFRHMGAKKHAVFG